MYFSAISKNDMMSHHWSPPTQSRVSMTGAPSMSRSQLSRLESLMPRPFVSRPFGMVSGIPWKAKTVFPPLWRLSSEMLQCHNLYGCCSCQRNTMHCFFRNTWHPKQSVHFFSGTLSTKTWYGIPTIISRIVRCFEDVENRCLFHPQLPLRSAAPGTLVLVWKWCMQCNMVNCKCGPLLRIVPNRICCQLQLSWYHIPQNSFARLEVCCIYVASARIACKYNLISSPTSHLRSHGVDSFPSTMLLNAHSNPHFGVGAEPRQELLEPIAVHLVRKPPGQWDRWRKGINQTQ